MSKEFTDDQLQAFIDKVTEDDDRDWDKEALTAQLILEVRAMRRSIDWFENIKRMGG